MCGGLAAASLPVLARLRFPSSSNLPKLAAQYIQVQVAGPLYVDDVVEFAGDSITNYGEQSGGFIDIVRQFCDAYHADCHFTFHGSGVLAETSSQLLARFDALLAATHPNVVVIATGINDINAAYVAGVPVDTNLYATNLVQMIDKARNAGVRQVVMMTPLLWGELPLGWGPYDPQIAAMIGAMNYVSQLRSVPVIDARSLFLDADVVYNPGHQWSGIVTWEGVHPNALGAQLLGGCVIKAFGM